MSAKSRFTVATTTTAASFKSTAAIVAESMAPGMDGEGNIWLVFRGSEGKGTGQQEVPMLQLPDLCDAIANILENGAPEEDDLTAAQMFTRTFALRDAPEGREGQFCTFRLNSGKGAKPVTIPLADLGKFYEALLANLPIALRSVKSIKGVSQEAIEAALAMIDELPEA